MKFRLQTLFMFVLIVAAALVSIESAFSHKRETEAQRRIVELMDDIASLRKVLESVEPERQAMERNLSAAIDISRKNGFEPELVEAIMQTREKSKAGITRDAEPEISRN